MAHDYTISDMRKLKMEQRINTLYKLISREGIVNRRIVLYEFNSKVGVKPETIAKYLTILQERGLVRLKGEMVVALYKFDNRGA
ncbi:MAG: hypothetical protein NZ896_03925 [Nitrososphaerales archaeon]|nr:hypothetical protein [Nitrososphaerales archaeon]